MKTFMTVIFSRPGYFGISGLSAVVLLAFGLRYDYPSLVWISGLGAGTMLYSALLEKVRADLMKYREECRELAEKMRFELSNDETGRH